MEFKYHKSYKGFYLIEGNKFKRPYQKLDQEKTLENLNGKLEFDENRITKIDSKAVVFIDKNEGKSSKEKITKVKKIQKTVEEIDFESLELKYKIPKLLLKKLYTIISENSINEKRDLLSVLSVIENLTISDGLFFSKVKKIFYYGEDELSNLLARYNFDNLDVVNLKKDIEVNYPSQFISNLPIDYKEYEMIFVFYFIILIELITILK